MSSDLTLVAYTESTNQYPGYINLRIVNDKVVFAVRDAPKNQDGMVWCGETSEVILDIDLAKSIIQEALNNIKRYENKFKN